jgi:CubicO group peptidase (beta-lactamase class C family)
LRRRGFNGSLLLAHQGNAVYNKSFGYARVKGKMEFSQHENIFQLASVGKQFTAMATLILYERGLIGLDDPVARHIEGFPYPNITVRHLLNHTSGLQNYFPLLEQSWKKQQLPVHQDLLDIFIARKLPLNFPPGTRFSYSNTGYAFLAMLVESVSGEPFTRFAEKNMFRPLGMKNSFVYHPSMNEDFTGKVNLSLGYIKQGRAMREISVEVLDGITGDKGIFSTTEDLLRWDTALEQNLLISLRTRELAFSAGQLHNGKPIQYGFGYRIRPLDDHNIIYHNGWWRGFKTSYVRLPNNTLLVILNNTNASLSGLEDQIRKIIDSSTYPVFETLMASEPAATNSL